MPQKNEITATTQNRLKLIAILWTIIVAKCYLLEYWTISYQAPINTKIFVWLLSLAMALFATIVFVSRIPRNFLFACVLDRPAVVWISVWAVSLCLTFLKIAIPGLTPPFTEWLIGIFICFGYFYNGVATSEPVKIGLGFAWIFAVGLIASAGIPQSYLYFSGCLFFVTTLPEIVAYVRQRHLLSGQDGTPVND